MKRKTCRECKIFYDGPNCPICKGNGLATSWQGRVNVLDVDKSMIAKKIKVTVKGEYALKIR